MADLLGGADRIVPSSRVTQNQAMLIAANPENMEIIESVPVRMTGPIDDPKTKTFYWDVYWIGTFALYHPTALCEITGVA